MTATTANHQRKEVMKNAFLHDLFILEVQDLYSAELQLVKALPKMADAAHTDELREGFQDHLAQTEEHVKRLQKIASTLDFPAEGKECKGMAGLISEGEEMIKTMGKSAIRDLALISAAQKVEHYEIAGYGTVRTLAEMMEHDEQVEILQMTLDEEGETDELLTEAAETIMSDLEDSEE